MRALPAELPDDPSAEQVDAWIELAELVADRAFQQRARQMALASGPQAAQQALDGIAHELDLVGRVGPLVGVEESGGQVGSGMVAVVQPLRVRRFDGGENGLVGGDLVTRIEREPQKPAGNRRRDRVDLPDAADTLVLDGLPRNYSQAERLHTILDVVQIFHLKINDTSKASDRLKARALRENRLDDMNEEVIRRRMNTYYEETFKTLSFYPPELVYDVDAGQMPMEVLRDIINRLCELEKERRVRRSAG